MRKTYKIINTGLISMLIGLFLFNAAIYPYSIAEPSLRSELQLYTPDGKRRAIINSLMHAISSYQRRHDKKANKIEDIISKDYLTNINSYFCINTSSSLQGNIGIYCDSYDNDNGLYVFVDRNGNYREISKREFLILFKNGNYKEIVERFLENIIKDKRKNPFAKEKISIEERVDMLRGILIAFRNEYMGEFGIDLSSESLQAIFFDGIDRAHEELKLFLITSFKSIPILRDSLEEAKRCSENLGIRERFDEIIFKVDMNGMFYSPRDKAHVLFFGPTTDEFYVLTLADPCVVKHELGHLLWMAGMPVDLNPISVADVIQQMKEGITKHKYFNGVMFDFYKEPEYRDLSGRSYKIHRISIPAVGESIHYYCQDLQLHVVVEHLEESRIMVHHDDSMFGMQAIDNFNPGDATEIDEMTSIHFNNDKIELCTFESRIVKIYEALLELIATKFSYETTSRLKMMIDMICEGAKITLNTYNTESVETIGVTYQFFPCLEDIAYLITIADVLGLRDKNSGTFDNVNLRSLEEIALEQDEGYYKKLLGDYRIFWNNLSVRQQRFRTLEEIDKGMALRKSQVGL